MLDTDICIYVIKRRPPGLRDVFNRNRGMMAVSSVTLAELFCGAEKSARREENLENVEHLASRLEVLPFDELAAAHYGQIRADLERVGKPIGPYDLMIAGHARSRGLILISNNTREFGRVDGLMLDNWI